MNTKVIELQKLTTEEKDSIFKEAATIIQNGGLVAFPTETVYGLGGNALNPEASSKIYAAKGRPSDNPLIAHVANLEQVVPLVTEITPVAKELMNKFWPGPMTLILNKSEIVPLTTTGGRDTVAIRMPNHQTALRLIEEAGVPIAAPSANLSGRPSPTQASHVVEDLSGRIEMILDDGQTDIGIESTIIDLTEDKPVILRPGYITPEMLEEVIGKTEENSSLSEEEKPKAPGMKYKHYAPKANLIVVEGNEQEVVREILTRIKEQEQVGVICSDETRQYYKQALVKSIGSRHDVKSVAHNLYRVLREFDESDVSVIYSEAFGETEFGEAIMNRLVKAAGHQVIKV
jgi:L-threonylcarbamoyladenylate synthase